MHISKPEDRAQTLTRFDGMEKVGSLIGIILSPIVFLKLGRYGNFGLATLSVGLSILYTCIFIPNNPSVKKNRSNYCKKFVINPLVDMVKTIFKRRPKGLHWLIAIQFVAYAMYCLSHEEFMLRYFFLQNIFEGFGPVEFAVLNVYLSILQAIGLLVVVPIINRFQLHDSGLLTIFVGLETIGI